GARECLERSEALAQAANVGTEDVCSVRAALILSTCERREEQLDKAEDHAAWAHRLSEAVGDPDLRSRAAHQRGRIARARGDSESALHWLRGAEAEAKHAGLLRVAGHCQMDQGAVLVDLGNSAEATRCFTQAVDLFRECGATGELGMALL